MTQNPAEQTRSLVALVRADGQGELRDGERVTRMRAASSDELRGMVMERAIAVAVDEHVPVRVRVIDVDGVYPLVLTPDGRIDQDGPVEPLEPGDVDLTPESPAHEDVAQLFGAPEPESAPEEDADEVAPALSDDSLHETIRLPRPGMMAPLVPPVVELDTPDEELPAEPLDAMAATNAGEVEADRSAADATDGTDEAVEPTDDAVDEVAEADDIPASDSDDSASEADEAQAETEPVTETEPDQARLAAADAQPEPEAETDLASPAAADGQTEPEAEPQPDQASPAAADGQTEPELDQASPASADEPVLETDEQPIVASLFEDEVDLDAAPSSRPRHEDADDLLSEATSGTTASASAPTATDDDDWAPPYTRGRIGLGTAPERGPGYPEMPLFPSETPTIDAPADGADGDADEHRAADVASTDLSTPSALNAAPPRRVSAPPTGAVPTLDDFFAASEKVRSHPAEQGWRARLRQASGGLIKLGPGPRERAEREEIATIQRTFEGPRTIVVVNPKGGAHKTTASLMIAATFGAVRGGYTLAWDNNETRGTLGWRSKPGATKNTAVDLLRELPRFAISGGATISDVDRFVRNQGDAKFDVLASDDDAASAAIIDDDAFSRLHRVLSRFYRIMVIDTGNNMRASNWEAALDVADQLVIVSTAREDTAASAAWLADGLRERGYGDKLANAVTILSSPSAKEDAALQRKLEGHFSQLTRAVVRVPYDQEFVGGGELDIPSLQPATRQAWRHAAAVIAQGL